MNTRRDLTAHSTVRVPLQPFSSNEIGWPSATNRRRETIAPRVMLICCTPEVPVNGTTHVTLTLAGSERSAFTSASQQPSHGAHRGSRVVVEVDGAYCAGFCAEIRAPAATTKTSASTSRIRGRGGAPGFRFDMGTSGYSSM